MSTHEQPAISLEPLTFQLTDRDGDTITVTSADIAIVTTGAVPVTVWGMSGAVGGTNEGAAFTPATGMPS